MNKILPVILITIVGLGFIYWLFTWQSNEETLLTEFPSPTPPTNIPSDWQTYNSENYKYSISYPGSYILEPNGDYSITLLKLADQPSVGPANFIYISVVPEGQAGNEGEIYNYNPESYTKLQELEIEESVSLSETGQEEWFTYTRIDTVEIDNRQAKVYENTKPWEFPTGTAEVRYILDTDAATYILGYYYGGENLSSPIDAREAFRIISTFQLQ